MPIIKIADATFIRPIEEKDYITMSGIIERFLFEEVPNMPKVNKPEDVRDIFYTTPFICYHIIEHEGKIVGGGGLRELAGSVKTCEGSRMYFAPEVRGKGFAIPLLRLLSQEAMKRGYAKVFLETQPAFMTKANSIYQRCGFELTSQVPSFCFRQENTFMHMYLQERSMEEYPMPGLEHVCSTPIRYATPLNPSCFYILAFMGLDQKSLVEFSKLLLNLMEQQTISSELVLLPEQIQAIEQPALMQEEDTIPTNFLRKNHILSIGFFDAQTSSANPINLEAADIILKTDTPDLPRETLFSVRALELACKRPNCFTKQVSPLFSSLRP